MPAKVITVDLADPFPKEIPNAKDYECIWIILTRYGIPIQRVLIDNCYTPVLEMQLRSEIVRQTIWELVGQEDYTEKEKFAFAAGQKWKVPPKYKPVPELTNLLPNLNLKLGQRFFLSIVVPTYDRPKSLEKCLSSLVKLKSSRHRFELIVVDNNPTSGQTKFIVDKYPQILYETETRPGVAAARNKGLKVARGDVVAFVDDDVIVPPNWAIRILAPFTDDRVMCVSGLVLPLELETKSQELFEAYGALGRGYKPKIYDAKFFSLSKRYAVHTWDLGGTANMAVRKSVISQTGMFDETLGPGLPTGVGEDIYMFYRILKFGHICYYEPGAYVWHKHRRDIKSLYRQLYNYSKGQTSYQLRTLVSDGDKRALWQLLWDLPKWHLGRIFLILSGRYKYPFRLLLEEVRGNLIGVLAFYKAVRMHRRLNGPGTNPINPERINF